ncbi:hypothetical protein Tco_0308190 [Tanacetum coccineum]
MGFLCFGPSSRSLIGEASTFAVPPTAEPVTTLSTTFASSGFVPPLSVSDYQVLDAKPHDGNPPTMTLEEKELDAARSALSAAYLAWGRCLHFMHMAFLKVANVPCLWQNVPVAFSKLTRSPGLKLVLRTLTL